jgi:MFS family permease
LRRGEILSDMPLEPYRRVFARPGVPSLVLVTMLARIPITAAPVMLTLHVVLELHRGFGQSGLIAAVSAIGAAVGSPLLGHGFDRIGLRPILLLTTVAETAFWLSAAWLPYGGLLVAAFLGGLLGLPIFSLSRQALAAMVPPEQRQAGFSVDSMSVEISYAIGPALGVVLLTQCGSVTAFLAVAATIAASGGALWWLNPPVRGVEGEAPDLDHRSGTPAAAVPLRSWFGARVVAVLLATAGATFTLAGTDVALTAAMRSFDKIDLLGLVFAAWCLSSLVGGFVYGLSSRRIDPLLLLALLAALTVPVAAATSWWLLVVLIVPSGLCCAPLISSTAQVLTAVTPAAVRGKAMGVHSSALTLGNAAGAPLVGLIVDRDSPRAGFVAIGVLGLALALVALLGQSARARRRAAGAADETPASVSSGAAPR